VWYYKSLWKVKLFKLYLLQKITITTQLQKSFHCKIKELLTQFQRIHDELKDENEIAIAEKYSSNARRYTIGLTSKIIISTFLYA